MTLLLIMEAIDSGQLAWDDPVTASETAAAKGGSQVFLKAGEQMTVEDMVKSIAVSSANDCACAMAEHLCGSEAAFVERMNQRAAELGMADTHFVNCTGLDDGADAASHRTSAHDIALMSRELLTKHPDIKQYTTITRMDDAIDYVTNAEKQIEGLGKRIKATDESMKATELLHANNKKEVGATNTRLTMIETRVDELSKRADEVFNKLTNILTAQQAIEDAKKSKKDKNAEEGDDKPSKSEESDGTNKKEGRQSRRERDEAILEKAKKNKDIK